MDYTTSLASADAFLRAILMAAQANPDPTSWSPIASSPGARDVILLASDGLHTLHFDEDGVVTSSQDGASQPSSPSSDLSSRGAGSLALAVDTPSGTVTGGRASLADDGLPSGAGSSDLPAPGASQTYATDLASADAFLRDVLRAAQANPDPSSWSPITSNTSARDVVLLAANGLQTLHFDENGEVTPGTASPPALALATGAGPGAVPAGAVGGFHRGADRQRQLRSVASTPPI